MAFTYDGDPGRSSRDEVRFLLGDTTSPGDLSDEEVDYLLATYTTAGSAALNGARTLMAKFAGEVDRQVGDLRISASQKYRQYSALIAELVEVASRTTPNNIYVGGQSRDERVTDEQDTDLPPPRFTVGQDDFPPNREDLQPLRGDL